MIIWNVIAVLISFLAIGAYAYFVRKEKSERNIIQAKDRNEHFSTS